MTSWSMPSPMGATPRPRAARIISRSWRSGICPSGAKIATVIGRYFAMDRDKRWERNKLAWDAIVLGRGAVIASYARASRAGRLCRWNRAAMNSCSRMIFCHANEQRIRDGDVILWFNFRADRARQLSEAFLRSGLQRLSTARSRPSRRLLHAHGIRRDLRGARRDGVSSPAEHEQHPRRSRRRGGSEAAPRRGDGEVSARHLLLQWRRRDAFPGRGSLPRAQPEELSKDGKEAPLPTYDMKPQMSAPDLAFEVVRRLEEYDLVIVNFANPDMVGPHRRRRGRHPRRRDHRPRRAAARGENARARRQALHHRRPRQLRADAQSRRLAQHRAHHQSRARHLRRRR